MLEITIKGASGSGKTTAALIIFQALRMHGGTVLVEESNPKESFEALLARRSRLNANSMTRLPSVIKTVQLPRGEVITTGGPQPAAKAITQENNQ